MSDEYRKQLKDLTEIDKRLYEWAECTTYEERVKGEDWVIRGVSKDDPEFATHAGSDGS